MGGASSIPTPRNNFHDLLITTHAEEFAQLNPCLVGILVYESNKEWIILTGNCNLFENF